MSKYNAPTKAFNFGSKYKLNSILKIYLFQHLCIVKKK